MRKFEGLHSYLTQNGIVSTKNVVEPSQIDVVNLLRVHSSEYINEIQYGFSDRKRERLLGLPWSDGLRKRSFLAVQGTLNAALMALQDGISGNLAGGTHHAFPDHGEGFCVFNDVAITIKALQASMWIKKALIIDCDVHQGNGTAFIFKDDPSVFTFSIHGEKNYPFRKQPGDLDIGLADGTTDLTYHKTLERALGDILSQFQPDIVFYLGGIDVLSGDRFGRINLTLDGLRRRDEIVLSTMLKLHIPTVQLLSGGYAATLKETVEAHAQQFMVTKQLLQSKY
ncbi:histone deacetylase [bacterium]|nr:MAG: histone deacetylase [bacterium]